MAFNLKRGRPPLPEEDRKRNSIRVRLTDSELDKVKTGAVANKTTVSDYIRERINDDRTNEGS